MTILASIACPVQAIDEQPTALDRQYAAESSPFALEALQSNEPTPVEALGEPWASWPKWAQADRWTLADEPEAFSLPVGADRLPMTDLDLPRRGATRIGPEEEARMWGRSACQMGDDWLIDRLQARDGYPD